MPQNAQVEDDIVAQEGFVKMLQGANVSYVQFTPMAMLRTRTLLDLCHLVWKVWKIAISHFFGAKNYIVPIAT